jgi:hypothetical protein
MALLEETVSSSRALDRALLNPLPFLFYTKLAVVNDIYKTIFMVFNDLFISCINPYPVYDFNGFMTDYASIRVRTWSSSYVLYQHKLFSSAILLLIILSVSYLTTYFNVCVTCPNVDVKKLTALRLIALRPLNDKLICRLTSKSFENALMIINSIICLQTQDTFYKLSGLMFPSLRFFISSLCSR